MLPEGAGVNQLWLLFCRDEDERPFDMCYFDTDIAYRRHSKLEVLLFL
jgi:hypothetical protein